MVKRLLVVVAMILTAFGDRYYDCLRRGTGVRRPSGPVGRPGRFGSRVVRLDAERDLVCYIAVVRNISAPTSPRQEWVRRTSTARCPQLVSQSTSTPSSSRSAPAATSPGAASAPTATLSMRCWPTLNCSTSTCTTLNSPEVLSKAASASESILRPRKAVPLLGRDKPCGIPRYRPVAYLQVTGAVSSAQEAARLPLGTAGGQSRGWVSPPTSGSRRRGPRETRGHSTAGLRMGRATLGTHELGTHELPFPPSGTWGAAPRHEPEAWPQQPRVPASDGGRRPPSGP